MTIFVVKMLKVTDFCIVIVIVPCLYEIIGKVIFEGSVLGRRPTINLKTFPGH